VNESLKKFGSVNKKALEQYLSFHDHRDVLKSRGLELEKEKQAIDNLIMSLDNQKESTILKTFQNVNKHFTDVFHELVPGGM
jgi:structural maintenance of chromosome 3 (chondroitin sulfate proteoglycan 6)